MDKQTQQLSILEQRKETFINKLVDKLESINKLRIEDKKTPLDICFMTSVVDTKIMNYDDFMNNLQYKYFIEDYKEDETGGHTNGSINVQIRNGKKTITYTIIFDSYYITDLDQTLPSFQLEKTEYIDTVVWDVFEDEDYNEYQKRYIQRHQKTLSEREEKEKLKKKQDIQAKINLLTQQLQAIDL